MRAGSVCLTLALWAALLASAGVPARAAGSADFQVFPPSDEVFRRLLADPRQVQLGASYYRQNREDLGDVALGHSWGLARWRAGGAAPWTWQWAVEGMAFSRFLLSRGLNEFQTVDFFANLPIAVRRGGLAGKALVFHESSHLGDDYIRNHGAQGFRYSQDGLRGLVSYEPVAAARVYGGGSYVLHMVGSRGRPGVQCGAELQSPTYRTDSRWPHSFYLAEDFQSRASVSWNPNSYTVLGLRLGFKEGLRSMRLHAGYLTGHSPYGQFFQQHEDRWDLGVSFDL